MLDASARDRYARWKSLIPVLYDYFCNRNVVWPSLSCRWGPQLEQRASYFKQQIYFTEQTYEGYPNALVVANCEVDRPRIADAESLNQFSDQGLSSSSVKKFKSIFHPGEVNRIRELPQDKRIVATHTDKPEVFIWNMATQPTRPSNDSKPKDPSIPDLVLTGHTSNAPYALAFSAAAPYVLSGGEDKAVVLWDIREPLSARSRSVRALSSSSRTVPALGTFQGHNATVEDVQFKPSSYYEFCSVGDDAALLLWDARSGHKPVAKVARAHDGDVHCVDWNAQEDNYILTGSADQSAKVFDQRKLATNGEVKKFKGHTSSVLCVQWCPHKPFIFGTSGEDGLLNLWDMQGDMIFQHPGHRGEVPEFHWNASDPWLILSLSKNSEGGGTLQLWRMNDMIYRDEEEVITEMVANRKPLVDN